MTYAIFDDRQCELGEGPLWHPTRQQFFWFDILKNQLLSRKDGAPLTWQFGENVSAAGWTGDDTLLIASETRLFEFNLETGDQTDICALEADDPGSRSNDGRADPQGGFWIGTMAKRGETRPGTIYRYYRGELRQLFTDITVPNAMSFTPDGTHAYFSATWDGQIWRTALDADGWPTGTPACIADFSATGHKIDGMVVAADGTLWNAQYGAGRIAHISTDGHLLDEIKLPASQTTCPAFGGPDLKTLYCTSAQQDIPAEGRAKNPAHGQTFAIETDTQGQKEHRVIL